MIKQEYNEEKSIIEVLKDWAKDCSLKVISLIVNSKSIFKRIVWTAAIFLFAFILVQKLKQSIYNYMEFGTKASITVSSMSVCEFPIVKFRLISWLEYSLVLSKFYMAEKPENLIMSIGVDPRETFVESKNKFMSTFNIQESKFNANLHRILIQESIISCRFGNYICSIDDFDLIENRLDEAAYLRFKPSLTNENQCNSTLELLVFLGINTSISPIESEIGLELYISDPKQQFKVDFNLDENPILVRSGYTRIVLQPTITDLLPKPYNNCGEKYSDLSLESLNSNQVNDLYQQTISLIGAYSQKYCFELCLQKYLIDICDCYDESLVGYKPPLNLNKLETCAQKYDLDVRIIIDNKTGTTKKVYSSQKMFLDDNDYSLTCRSLVKDAFYSGDYVGQCSECPTECSRKIFRPIISRSKFPSQEQMNLIISKSNNENVKWLKNSSLEHFSEHFIRLELAVDNSHVIQKTQKERMSIKDLISELGEYLGMFLGMSILSAFEFVDLFVSIVSVYEKSIVAIMSKVTKTTYRFLTFIKNKQFNFKK